MSQPYLFQLFGTKKGLFLAAISDCFGRTGRHFEASARAAAAASPDTLDTRGILEAMGHAYVRLLLSDRNILRLQLHGYAACADPDVREAVRREFLALWRTIARISGAEEAWLQDWFAQGMLINVVASISDARTSEEFKEFILGGVTAQG